MEIEDLVIPSEDEVIFGTKRTQLFFIVRSFFVLIAIQGAYTIIMKNSGSGPLANSYSLLTYLGFMGAMILIDSKATTKNKLLYLIKGFVELIAILCLPIASYFISIWVKGLIPLPQIFFAMLLSAGLGFLLSKWRFGPTMRSLPFAGIPIVLAANFLIGGSRIVQAFQIDEMTKVISYGFFEQLLWMFGGIFFLIYFGNANHVRNLTPGMVGSLTHSGLTGACTAGDVGHEASARAPIMINIPFFGHLFVFTILAVSAKRGGLMALPSALVVLLGAAITCLSLRKLRNAKGEETKEVQGDVFGHGTASLIPFIFAMPFLVHPVVFGIFGRAMKNDGVMPFTPVIVFVILGIIGSVLSLTVF